MAVEAISKTNKQQIDELKEKEAINHDGRLINKTLSNYKMHQNIRSNLHLSDVIKSQTAGHTLLEGDRDTFCCIEAPIF